MTFAVSDVVTSITESSTSTIVHLDIAAATGFGEYGTACRFYRNSGYKFAIKDTGNVSISKILSEGNVEPMPGAEWRPTTAFHPGGMNRLITVCRNKGNTTQLQLWLNGEPIFDIIDPAPLIVGPVVLYVAADTQQTLSVDIERVQIDKT